MIETMRSENEEIVITGIGVVSPIGIGKEAFWKGLDEGRSGIKSIAQFDTSRLNSKLGGEVTNFKPEDILGPHGLRNYDRCISLALSASKLALQDGSLTVNAENSSNFGIVLGASLGGIKTISEIDKQSIREGPRSLDPGLCPNVVLCSPASQISIRFGIKGFTTTISAGFNSSYYAFRYGLDLLRSNREIKYLLVGAVEEFCEQVFKGFYYLGYLSGSHNGHTEINAPYDRRRNGFILGEGAVMFILEPKDEAVRRGAKVYAKISDYEDQFIHYNSQYSLQYSLRNTEEVVNGLPQKLRNRLNEIDFVSLGANSSVLGDALESNLMRHLFTNPESYPEVGAIKSLVGESYSVGGCSQLLGALYALDQERGFPTVGFELEDERCPAPFLAKKRTKRNIHKALIWSVGYGRSNHYIICEKI